VSEYQNHKFQVRLPIILSIGLAAGILIGATMSQKGASPQDVNKSVQKFREVLGYIDRNYVDKIDTESLTEEAIVHLLSKLDPHSSYIPPKDKQRANEELQGNFDGIGVEFNIFRDTIVVVAPLSGGPSEAVGIQSGDMIIKINGKDVAGVGFTNRDVQENLKGPKGTEVEVTVLRKSQKNPINFKIVRDKIPQYSVDVSYMIDEEIGYIKISRFSATTYDEFKSALTKLKAKGMQKLIIDLQGNPGGYMNHAILIADELLPGKDKIVYTKGKESRYNTQAFAERKGIFEEGALIVLVNEGSASASEIVSGALQDNDRALIVGRRSFGKGLVQAPIELSDGSELRLTISRYYTPSGRSIQKPYTAKEEYGKELLSRYNQGEFFHADSIKFNDSLRYATKSGRAVYGGGGIMPDYFVPLDTTLNSTYLNNLYIANAIQEYTFNYTEKNKRLLERMDFEEFLAKFTVTDAMLADLVKTGQSVGVKSDPKQLKRYRDLIALHVKAQIGRKIWNNEGFYPIFNQTNEVLQQAIKMFDKIEDLNRNKF
jgi:carboxyl-terminal processing protease